MLAIAAHAVANAIVLKTRPSIVLLPPVSNILRPALSLDFLYWQSWGFYTGNRPIVEVVGLLVRTACVSRRATDWVHPPTQVVLTSKSRGQPDELIKTDSSSKHKASGQQ